MIWTSSAYPRLKHRAQQLTKFGKKENFNHLPLLSAVTNINSWKVKSALSNVVSLVSPKASSHILLSPFMPYAIILFSMQLTSKPPDQTFCIFQSNVFRPNWLFSWLEKKVWSGVQTQLCNYTTEHFSNSEPLNSHLNTFFVFQKCQSTYHELPKLRNVRSG